MRDATDLECSPNAVRASFGSARETLATRRALGCVVGMGSLSMSTKREITNVSAR